MLPKEKEEKRTEQVVHLGPPRLVLATHPKSSAGGHAHTSPRDFNNPKPSTTTPSLPPNQSEPRSQQPAGTCYDDGDPVLRRRVPPPRRRPAQRAGGEAPSRHGGRAGRGGGRGRRDKPGHQEGGGQGGRHRPHRRARQAAHRLLPVRLASHRIPFLGFSRMSYASLGAEGGREEQRTIACGVLVWCCGIWMDE